MGGTTDKGQLVNKVRELVHQQLGIDLSELADDKHFVDDYGADSLDLTELVITVEDEFGISIPESELGDMNTVISIVNYILQQQK
ncbi:acyl carrier protein [Paenibacillus protaetiae]|uniref:Acyl carrier protein n=1 Tax=Paenibacillus protaetiae TaxID=2509456 RepID=A0A4P6EX44_9BACL|nr:acyl carrier protein [Paenibacillus protaetiae]QAY67602.1 acyl carrier protein [Paenibacillus protaetiae]